MNSITEQIRNHLKARGDSVRRIATVTGLQRATVSDFLNGRDVRGQTLDALAVYLGASITFGPAEPSPPKPKANKRASGG